LKRLLDGERSTWAKMLGRVADAAGIHVLTDHAYEELSHHAENITYIDPATQLVEEVLRESGRSLSTAKKRAVIEVVRAHISDSLKEQAREAIDLFH
jgi:hypothetical protein